MEGCNLNLFLELRLRKTAAFPVFSTKQHESHIQARPSGQFCRRPPSNHPLVLPHLPILKQSADQSRARLMLMQAGWPGCSSHEGLVLFRLAAGLTLAGVEISAKSEPVCASVWSVPPRCRTLCCHWPGPKECRWLVVAAVVVVRMLAATLLLLRRRPKAAAMVFSLIPSTPPPLAGRPTYRPVRCAHTADGDAIRNEFVGVVAGRRVGDEWLPEGREEGAQSSSFISCLTGRRPDMQVSSSAASGVLFSGSVYFEGQSAAAHTSPALAHGRSSPEPAGLRGAVGVDWRRADILRPRSLVS